MKTIPDPLIQLIRGLPVAVALFDKNMRYIACSDRWMQDYMIAADPTGLDYSKASPLVLQAWQTCHGQSMQGETVRKIEDVVERPDGSHMFVTWECRPWISDDQLIQGVMITATDLTPFVESNNRLYQQAKLTALGQMASGVAHEINNPLSVIRMNTEILMERLQQTPGDTALADRCRKIIHTSDRISSILRALKSISASSARPAFEWVTIDSLKDDILELCSPRLRQELIDLEMDIEATSGQSFYLDRAQILQTLINLLNNSIDALSEREKKWIRISSRTNSQFLILQVEDSGDGIPDSVLKKIMNPLFTTKNKTKGLGLGLNLIMSYVACHKGTLHYELIDGHTAFTVELPMDVVRPQPAEPVL